MFAGSFSMEGVCLEVDMSKVGGVKAEAEAEAEVLALLPGPIT